MSLPLKYRLQSLILRNGLAALSSTWRFDEQVPEECRDVLEGREPVVIVVWHGSMLPAWYRFRRHDAAVFVSSSRDGELLVGFLRRLGYHSIIRGSSSKGGSEALAAGVAALESRSLMITPDGPRGPARVAKPGALVAAARSGRRILMVGCTPDRAMRVRSWDRLAIPYPFTTIRIRYCITEPFQPSSSATISKEDLGRFDSLLSSLDDDDTGGISRPNGAANPSRSGSASG